ncbi:MFS transporter [Flavisphingomonas formosensis]|uniref:MFS transporter n=1 Tax=Flavisphingomonas formosensis TaxID=861534 RepID=UPI0012F8298E|nr:MFS transporter [Sphingomonas formosensis]
MAKKAQNEDGKVPLGIAMAVSFAFFMENFDGTVLATALPSIARTLDTTAAAANLGITAYFLSLAIFISLSGWLADRFGTRTTFTAAMLLFALTSLACAFSTSLAGFAVARTVQGMAGAMMVPVGRLIILQNASRAQLVRAMSLVTTPALMGSVLGPPIGGLLCTYASWRMIFFVNLPVALLGIVLIRLYVPQVREAPRKFDWPGFFLSAGAVGTLMLGLQSVVDAAALPWLTVGLITTGAVLLGALLWHARRRAEGLIDLSLFRYETFRAVIFGGGLFFVAIGAMPYLLPLLLQIGLGASAFVSGMVVFSSALGGLFVKRLAPILIRRFGFRTVLIFNALGIASAMILAATIVGRIPIGFIAVILFGIGLLRSLQFSALNTMVYADVPQERSSRATSLADTLKQLWQGLGVGIAAVVLHLLQQPLAASPRLLPFQLATVAMALVGACAVLVFLRLATDAGSAVSGHAARPAPVEPQPQQG